MEAVLGSITRKRSSTNKRNEMKVEDVMTRNVKSCRPEDNLSQVTALMWDYDFGAMPVVDDANRVMGMITDRDIAIATWSKGRLATEINVGEVMSGNVYACALDEDVSSALKTMRREKVRRLPVIGRDGKLAGVLSINDIVLRAEEAKGRRAPEIPYEEVVNTFKAVCEHSMESQAVVA
jgi:CBS domain-containing protein